MLQRLQKIIAQAGIASRRHAEELIRSGQVRVNGAVVTELGSKADPDHDRVEVAGRVAEIPEQRVYVLLNKPPDVVSTMADPEGRTTLRNFLRGMPERVFPVGRLDYFASGLLLLTNDGELTARVLRAAKLLRQTYWIKVKGRISESEMQEAGRAADAHFAPLKGPWARRSAENPWYEVELTGASRDALGRSLQRQKHPIEKMKRVQLGTLDLDNVPEGHYRRLEPDEVDKFSRAVDRALAEPISSAAAAPIFRPAVASPKTFVPARPVALPSFPPPLGAQFKRPQPKPREPWRARQTGPPRQYKSGAAPRSQNQPRPGAPTHRPGAPPQKDWRAQKSGPWRGNKSGGPPRSQNQPRPGAPTHRPGAPAKQDWRAQKSGPWRGNKTGAPPRSQNQSRPGAPTHRPDAPAKHDWRAEKSGPWRGNKTGGPPRSQGQPRPGQPHHRPGAPEKREWRGDKTGGAPSSQNRPTNRPQNRPPNRPQNNAQRPDRPQRPPNFASKRSRRPDRPDRDPRHTPRHSR
jgi:23S rRNA pseudouridine2605 synthase